MIKSPDVSACPGPPIDDDAAWRAVLERDWRFDREFVYAVSSTLVFCRPSCPSRRPRRERVAFYSSPSEAIRAGYRACKRCRPDEVREDHDFTLVNRLRALLDDPAGESLSLEALAGEVGVSPARVRRVVTRAFGVSPKAYQGGLRAARFRARLLAGDTVSRATYEAGYGSSSRVYEKSAGMLGMTPTAYRRGGAGVRIRYTIVDSLLGKVLVGLTARGVCAVALGDSEEALEAGFKSDFHEAVLERATAHEQAWVMAVVTRVNGRPAPEVPLDVAGTVFQWQVWDALRRIPEGSTRSYSAVAASIGRPTAARAVARACATNRAAIIIPCHRVVREDGMLGGYRWGLDRKRQLLDRERRGKGEGQG